MSGRRDNRRGAPRLARLLTCALLLAGGPLCADEPETILRLGTGGQTVLDVTRVVRVSVGDPAVADVQKTEDERQLIITARSPGETDLILWEEGGATRRVRVLVGGLDPARLAASLREILSDVEGIDVREVGGRVLLDGSVLTRDDLARVERVAAAYEEVVNLVRLDLTAHNGLLAREIASRIGCPTVSVSVVGDRAILNGQVFREADRALAATVAGAFVPDVVNLLQVEAPMVEVDVRFLQVDVETSDRSGFNVLDRARASVGSSGPAGDPVVSVEARAPVAVQEMIGRGHANVLAQPFLTTLSGEEATFHSGGEQGYRVATAQSAGVEFKKHGLILKVRPDVLSSGEVRLRMAIEVSMPTSEAVSEDLSFNTFTTESEIVCRIDESLVVSGLAQSLRHKFRERTPLLGSIPILSAFFRENAEGRSHQDILLVVTPRVPLLERARGRPASEEIRDRLTPPATPPAEPQEPARERRVPPRPR
ncbi:MAG: pilus assembly protein N-terminal domain-containing protein [Planctomycetes bacterium]|nr:pilus assembly protein N-terminal domain-containing protein [Planctomycetota bacterium]